MQDTDFKKQPSREWLVKNGSLKISTVKHVYSNFAEFKGCVRYIFASLFMSKREHLRNKEKCFLFHFESSSRSWDNELLTF